MASSNHPDNDNLDGVHGRPATPEEIAQRDGYARGRNDENYVQRNMREQERIIAQSRANDSAASGMVFGLVIALLAAGAGAAFFFLGGMGRDRPEITPAEAPQIQKEVIEKETTIIERQAPAVSLPDVQVDIPEIKVPDIDVTGESEPAAEEPPATAEPEAAPAESE